jgi:ABC-type branched-subunit amino acid transport system substrate-binding protein
VTPKTITIAAMAGFTGVLGPVVEGFYGGYETWRDDVNARGGIFGRQVVLKKVDHKDSVEGAVAACKKIVDDNDSYMVIFLLGFYGSDVAALNCLDKAGIPVIGVSNSAYKDTWTNVHTMIETWHPAQATPSFIKNKLGRGATKIGLFITGNGTIPQAGKKPFEAEMKRLGLKIVHTETVSEGQSNLVAEMTRMRNAGAETVVMNTGLVETVAGLRDARAIGYRPTFVAVVWNVDETSAGTVELMRGIEGTRAFATADSKAYAAFEEKHRKYGGKTFSATVAAVYGDGLFTEKVLRNVGANPTRPGLAPAIESITNYNNGYIGLSFGKGVKRATTQLWPTKCCQDNGAWIGTGPPKVRF